MDTKRWYSLEITVPDTVQTSDTPINIQVTLENATGDKAYGTVELMVNRNITSSIAPVIENAYSSPTYLTPGSSEDVYFYVYVTDSDGIETINNVVIDLGPIGGGPMLMESVTSSSASQATGSGSGISSSLPLWMQNLLPVAKASFSAPTSNGVWYRTTSPFHVPLNLKNTGYNLKVTATDQTGETGSLTFKVDASNSVNKPTIDSDRIYVTPRESIPNDGETKFSIYAYVADPNGLDDVVSVFAELEELQLPPVHMVRDNKDDADVDSSELVGAWYVAKDLTIPVEVFTGIKQIFIIASDRSGGETESGIEIKVTSFDELGDAPEVDTGRNYTTPNLAYNDEKTKIGLYSFIYDKDNDVDYVMVNLSNVARYQGIATGTGQTNWDATTAQVTDPQNPCDAPSDTIVCMRPSVREGDTGQWFVLPEVVVLKEVEPGIEPYRVWVTAIDKTGKSSQGYININVTDGNLPAPKTGFPILTLATATATDTVELVFSNPLDREKIKSNGSDFKVTEESNVSAVLNISKAVINAEGTIVTLTTSKQDANKEYTVIADSAKLGLKDNRVSDSLADFTGYKSSSNRPEIQMITAKSSYSLEIVFNEPIKPTSVELDGSDFEIFRDANNSQFLKIYDVEQTESDTLFIRTDLQNSNETYVLNVKNLISSAGRPIKQDGAGGLFKGFQSLVHSSAELNLRADFNGDGRVDFTDFTMFSAVYGQIANEMNLDNGSSAGYVNTPVDDVDTPAYTPVDVTTSVPLEQ